MAKELSFEEKLKKLQELIDELEKGDLPLQISVKKYEEATKLSKELNKELDEIDSRIAKLVEDGNESNID